MLVLSDPAGTRPVDKVLAPYDAHVVELETLSRVHATHLFDSPGVGGPETRLWNTGGQSTRIGSSVPWALPRTNFDVGDEIPQSIGVAPRPTKAGNESAARPGFDSCADVVLEVLRRVNDLQLEPIRRVPQNMRCPLNLESVRHPLHEGIRTIAPELCLEKVLLDRDAEGFSCRPLSLDDVSLLISVVQLVSKYC